MHDDGSIPPMMPDDFAALAAFAGPMFQQSRQLEAFTSESPIPGAHKEYGSMLIKQGLEQAQHLARASALRQQPQPQYVPPAEPQFMQSIPYVPVDNANLQPLFVPAPVAPQASGDTQLEFCFDKKAQTITNELLEEISKKLTILIKLVDKTESEDRLPKSNPKKYVKNNQV